VASSRLIPLRIFIVDGCVQERVEPGVQLLVRDHPPGEGADAIRESRERAHFTAPLFGTQRDERIDPGRTRLTEALRRAVPGQPPMR
jgi:hypothetical protein